MTTDPGRPAPDPDLLLAAARELGADDFGAADRFLAGHRARLAQARRRQAGWLSVLLASAAVVTGLAVFRPDSGSDLPSSVAYEAYQGALGAEW
ncbi:hypothetical protein [Deinococcus navajonensis]|uniref:DUF3619 family protein n=1 Tax=Deinococcus navajonensis TaxID=309884 RepID=A0ABV8XQN9_9DEIO